MFSPPEPEESFDLFQQVLRHLILKPQMHPSSPARRKILPVIVVAMLWIGAIRTPAAAAGTGPAYQKTRESMLAKFDRNGDGWLDAVEREAMRMATKEARLKNGGGSNLPADFLADYDKNKDGDMDEGEWAGALIAEQQILTAKYDANKDGSLDKKEKEVMIREVRTASMRYARDYFAYLLVYDTNRNGQFDGNEYPQAQATEARFTLFTYDADGDGALDKTEKNRIQSDVRSGRIVGFYLRFVGDVIGAGDRGTRGGGGDYLTEQRKLLAFDTNRDGIASADELQRIRAPNGGSN